MICRTCGTEIADKALICYRCGAATTTPRITPPDERAPSSSPWPMLIALAALVLAALAAVELLEGPAESAALAAAAVAAVLAILLLRPGRRVRRRRLR
ncbi:MAG: hypothetical protein AB7O67_01855 [Vicinamibacterales bacterium]